MMPRSRLASLLELASLLLVAFSTTTKSCRGDLVIPPGGTELLNDRYLGNVVDEESVQRSTGLSDFRLFGRPLGGNLYVSENGNLSTAENSLFLPSTNRLPTTKLIAPLWDDVFLIDPAALAADGRNRPENRVWEQKQDGAFYAVTWQNIRLLNETVVDAGTGELLEFPDTVRAAQAALFGVEQSLRGFQFIANDIAFSYQSFDGATEDFVDATRETELTSGAFFLNAFVGLLDTENAATDEQGVEINGENLDADNSGFIESPEALGAGAEPRLPWTNQEFILFRELTDAGGNFTGYDVSIQRFSAVPEPSCLALMLIAGGPLLLRRRRRCAG